MCIRDSDELGQLRIALGGDRALFRGHAEHLHGARDVLRIRDEEAIGKRRRMRGSDDDGIGAVCSNASRYFFDHLREQGLPIAQIDVYETPNNCAIYRG